MLENVSKPYNLVICINHHQLQYALINGIYIYIPMSCVSASNMSQHQLQYALINGIYICIYVLSLYAFFFENFKKYKIHDKTFKI